MFSFEGDLWIAGVQDGIATRITAMQGYETGAKISPDGKWVAFTGRQYGNSDIYIMPVAGGDVKQLTWYSGADEVSSWSWDSKSIYFTSSRFSRLSSYKVSIDGGTAKQVFGDNFFLYDHNVAENPATGELFFNDTWESANQSQRKRYKGPFNPDIQSYNPATKSINVTPTGREKILVQRSIRMAIFILFPMKEMGNTTSTHLRKTKSRAYQLCLVHKKSQCKCSRW